MVAQLKTKIQITNKYLYYAKEIVKETGIKWKCFIFLEPHPDYPELKSLKDMAPQKVEPLFECNGFCGVNDLNARTNTEKEINYENEN